VDALDGPFQGEAVGDQVGHRDGAGGDQLQGLAVIGGKELEL
jgi:hypothetical protein